jgi:hypothetical protein
MTIIRNLPASQYHARPELNFSRLKAFTRSPFHFRSKVAETSAGFSLGSAAHTAILEPDTWTDRYRCQEATIRKGKAWDAELDAATQDGKEILRADDYGSAKLMAARVLEKPSAARLLKGAETELTIIQEIDQVPVRIRLDFVSPLAVGDLKSCRDLSRFAADVERYMYLAQASFYRHVWRLETGDDKPWKWLAIESAQPHDMAVIVPSDGDLSAGEDMWREWLRQHAACVTSGEWPGFDGGADEVAHMRPRWATKASETDEAIGGYDLTEESGDE